MAKWPVYRTPEALAKAAGAWRKPWHDQYLVMFSSYWGGFSTDPAAWGVPPDDHMVHRGDAVFEALKCVGGRVYCLDEHLGRLKASAEGLQLPLPPELAEVREIIRQAYELGGAEDLLIRLNVSRGPGSFTVNPYDSERSQLYLTTAVLKTPPPEDYERGASAYSSPFPAQTSFAHIKSCNYLQQVLAKKAALDAGANFAVSFDLKGLLTEGATENAVAVTRAGELLAPSYERILKGVTLGRVLDHAQDLVKEGALRSAGLRDIGKAELEEEAQEIFLTATTFDVMPVTKWDGRQVGDGRPGPVAKELARRLHKEAREDNPFTTNLKAGPRP